MPLDNCKRCGRLFQKSISNLCGGCYSYEQGQSMEIYRFIQENPGISIQDLSARFETPVQEMEALIFSGVLGTANLLVRSFCAMCKCEMTFVNRIGYFCYSCNGFVEKEAGVGKFTEADHRIENIRRGHSAFYKPIEEKKPAEKAAATPQVKAKFGFKRLSNEQPKH